MLPFTSKHNVKRPGGGQYLTNIFQGWMTVLLVPTLIQMLKIEKAGPNSDCSETMTQGSELLLLGLVTSATLLGTFFRHFIGYMLSFRKLQVIVA